MNLPNYLKKKIKIINIVLFVIEYYHHDITPLKMFPKVEVKRRGHQTKQHDLLRTTKYDIKPT